MGILFIGMNIFGGFVNVGFIIVGIVDFIKIN